MNKVCKFCNQQITEQTAAYKLGKLRNECKPCRSKQNVKYKQLSKEQKEVPCETCGKKCIKKFFKAFCSEICRFMGYVDRSEINDCWIWKGSIKQDGYGEIMVNHKYIRAHRYSFALFNGPLDARLQILHSCNTPKCVNPAHLSLGTPKENAQDMVKAGRQVKGKYCHLSKLDELMVKEIRSMFEQGATKEEIAARFDTSIGNLYWILTGKTWKHV